jgi:hypothetical protein
MNIPAEQQVGLELSPPAGADVLDPLTETTGGSQQQGNSQIGSGFGKDSRRVSNNYIPPCAHRQVDVVDTDGHRRDDSQPGSRSQQLAVDFVVEHAVQAIDTSHSIEQLRSRHRHVAGP